MEITINIEDYISKQRIAEICEEAVYEAVKGYMNNKDNFHCIVMNGAYQIVRKCIDAELFDKQQTFEEVLRAGVKKVIQNDVHSYDVFRYANPLYGARENNIGVILLEQAIRDNKQNIESAVDAIIKDYPFDEVKSAIADTCYEILEKKLFGGGKYGT